MYARSVALALATLVPCAILHAQDLPRQRVYLAPDDHTDYMWAGNEEQYRNAFLSMTDYYLDLSDKTQSLPTQFQSRWALDGAIWFHTFEHNRDPQQVDRLVARLKDGHFSMPLNFAVSTYGGTPTEAVLRGMYYAGSVERRYNLNLTLAVAMENQTLPRGLGALWFGSGARYSWKGICGCATKLSPTVFESRPHEIYWWRGPDGSRLLMKWYSLRKQPSGNEKNFDFGNYAEARDPSLKPTISFLDGPQANSLAFNTHYPYKIVGIFGEGWDNLATLNDKFVTSAQALTTPTREVIVSNEEDFFRDFEAHYGATLPNESNAFGNDWDTYSASMQQLSSSVRVATEKLHAAEALETLVALKQPGFPTQFIPARDKAWAAFGLYWEHNWTADNKGIPRLTRADWQRRIAADITGYVDNLAQTSNTALGALIRKQGTSPRFFVFNPLSWQRTDIADLPYNGPEAVHVIDLTTGKPVPSQFIDLSEPTPHRALRILASAIPPVGYKVFEIVPGATPTAPGALKSTANSIENESYAIRLNPQGAIDSIHLKSLHDRELVAKIDNHLLNDFGSNSAATITVKNAGPVSITLHAEVPGDLPHSTDITLVRGLDRIDLRNEINANFADTRTWTFSFNLHAPDVWHEEIGAINHARLQPEGDYAAKFSKLDWLTLNHYVSMTGTTAEAAGLGITLSSTDLAFMKLGHSDIANGISTLDTATPQITVLAGGQTDGPKLGIPAQGADAHFVQRFALRAQLHPTAAQSMRFALEDQNPLITGPVTSSSTPRDTYPEKTYSLLTISNPNILLWALKPSEEGIQQGIVTRFWNLTPQPAAFTIHLQPAIISTQTLTHIETQPKPLFAHTPLQAAPWQLLTFNFHP